MNSQSRAALAALSAAVCLGLNTGVARAQTLPAPWSARDVGGPALAGSSGSSGGTFTIAAAGVDIWGTSDEFHFVY